MQTPQVSGSRQTAPTSSAAAACSLSSLMPSAPTGLSSENQMQTPLVSGKPVAISMPQSPPVKEAAMVSQPQGSIPPKAMPVVDQA